MQLPPLIGDWLSPVPRVPVWNYQLTIDAACAEVADPLGEGAFSEDEADRILVRLG